MSRLQSRVPFNPTMMNHKLVKENCDVAPAAPPANVALLCLRTARRKHSEGGYTLVALLALMTIFAIFAMAVAPSIQQQSMRAREAEAIARGEEVAEAIRLYVRAKNTLPTSMDQLLEGVPRGTKKIQILRPEAARDPITGLEWRRIKQNDAAIINFEHDILSYAGTQPPFSAHPRLQVPKVVNILNIGSKDESPANAADDNLSDTDGPFIGVASRDTRASVITYYGIDHHDGWIFTPAINPHCDRSPTSCE